MQSPFRTAAVIVAASLAATTGVVAGAWRSQTGVVFVASTPCDSGVRRLLTIPSGIACDFVRWRLSLEARRFSLELSYGEAKPNTLDFVDGGAVISSGGTVDVVHARRGDKTVTLYRLVRPAPAPAMTLLGLNDNLLQLVSEDGGLAVGNGGWSYTLNREQPVHLASNPSFWFARPLTARDATQTIFEGRTPCREIAPRIGVSASDGCFKLKWKLTLNRDPGTHRPTTYRLDRTGHRDATIEGRWTIVNDGRATDQAAVYRLDPDAPATPLAFLAVDDRLLFFLDERGRVLVGNGDFSYTLNRRSESGHS